jgi:signal peptide peptidase SppA
MNGLPNLAARIIGTPLLIEPQAAAVILAVLADKLDVGGITFAASALDLAQARSQGRERQPREYEVSDGVAVLPIMGTLVSRGMGLSPQSGMTGYQEVGAAFGQAMADPDVRGVMLEVDSPGGEAAGAMEAARHLASFRGQKPIWSIVSPQAASAAYGLASAADRIVAPRGADVGSVGVLAVHTDRSGELAAVGRRVTIYQRGARKSDAHPFGPVTGEAEARLNQRLDGLYSEFVELVAVHRGLTEQQVRATEADTFDGNEALRLGLIDAVLDPVEAFAEFRAFLSAPSHGSTPQETSSMSYTAPPRAGAQPMQGNAAQIRAELAHRFTSICGLPDAGGALAPLAQHLALASDMSIDEAGAILALAKQAAKAGGGATDFRQAMAALRNPQVGADDGGGDDTLETVLARARAREGRT